MSLAKACLHEQYARGAKNGNGSFYINRGHKVHIRYALYEYLISAYPSC